MAIDANIVNFGQSNPTGQAISNFGNALGGAMQANKQSGLAENRKLAAGYLAQAFDDSSDEATTRALIEKAREADPEFTLATMQQVQKGSGSDRFSPTTINLPGGISIQTTSKGNKVVTDAGGTLLTGQAAIDAINKAEDVEASRAVKLAGDKVTAKESAKVDVLSKSTDIIADSKSKIAAAVDAAKRESEERGETFSTLQQAKASLPGLVGVVDQLKELAPLTTSTMAGNVFDFASKELGFGATDGATARAKFVAIINNQVLPLLKQTFGGAFSVAEGDSLKATMGDPNATTEEKIAQLDAFIESKYREIENKERLLESPSSPDKQGGFTSKSGITYTVEP